MDSTLKKEQCQSEITTTLQLRKKVPQIVDELVSTCGREDCFDHVSPEPIPSRDASIEIIERAERILYPGYFDRGRLDDVNLDYYYGQEATKFFEVLAQQITIAIRHECLRHEWPCTHCEERGHQEALRFMKQLPELRKVLSLDVRAAYEGDPAAKSYDEIILSYPGLFAVTVYRIAHQLFEQGVPLIPRTMSEYAHSLTGIDIHPGAKIGRSFFIDHGTGVVIGETTEVGNGVRIYQGVTLGALSVPKDSMQRLRNRKRHPTVEHNVIIYANATILGGKTVIGARAVIGGNVWITESVPPDTEIFLKEPELIVREKPLLRNKD
jgi:serine O-acetyltransferase